MADLLPFLGWLAVAGAAAVGGVIIVVAVRRWVRREESVQTFTFQDLRDLRDRGQITQKEFKKMRAALLAELDLDVPSGGPAGRAESREDEPPGESAGAQE